MTNSRHSNCVSRSPIMRALTIPVSMVFILTACSSVADDDATVAPSVASISSEPAATDGAESNSSTTTSAPSAEDSAAEDEVGVPLGGLELVTALGVPSWIR